MPYRDSVHLPPEVKFVAASSLIKLDHPWPRCQEVGHLHETPKTGDNLVVISQAWCYQLHPDPTGACSDMLAALLRKAALMLRAGGRLLVFCDYLCKPQPPVARKQPPWSSEDEATAAKVNEALPHLLFNADAVIHMCSVDDGPGIPEEKYTIPLDSLKSSCVLTQIGNVVQVAEEVKHSSTSIVKRYDQLLAVSGSAVKALEDLPEEFRTGKPGACSATCQSVFPTVASLWKGWPTAQMLRAPYGYRIDVTPAAQGHIFFEKFITMVKVALMEEASAQEVIFASDPQVKLDLLRGGARLRRATQQGLDALSTELEYFTQELEKKTFLPVPSEIARCHHLGMNQPIFVKPPTTDYDLVSHLMQIFVEELAIGVSLPLWSAVRENRLEDCRKLLKEQADPNLSDGRGTTTLHLAAQQREVEIVRLLIRVGAASTNRDLRGCTAAHCVPLLADQTTADLAEIFMSDGEALSLRNKAGVSVFERFYLWSISACNGHPFEPLYSRLRVYAGQHFSSGNLPDLWNIGMSSIGSTYPQSLTTVSTQVRRLNINGLMRTIYVLVPCHLRREPLLYLGFCRILPWSLQEQAVKAIAAAQECEIFCVCCDAVNPDLLTEYQDEFEGEGHEGEAFYHDLFHVIDALPLHDMFHMLDSTFGLGLPILWKLQERLKGVLVINPSWIWGSASVPDAHLVERAKQLSELARQKDACTMSRLLCEFSIAPSLAKAYFAAPKEDDESVDSADDMMFEAIHQQYELALGVASRNFWRIGALGPTWQVKKLTQVLNALPHWQPPRHVYVILACGSHAPVGGVHNAAYNLQELMTGSMQVYIPHCMWLWQIEGAKPIEEVIELLSNLRDEGTATASLNSMLVQKRRDLESHPPRPRRHKVSFSDMDAQFGRLVTA
ncbi:ankrd46 [Symbiodinium sp. CCMP2592]|nr:ankrd46 [Symbiodinium sp. CCMP2592]